MAPKVEIFKPESVLKLNARPGPRKAGSCAQATRVRAALGGVCCVHVD